MTAYHELLNRFWYATLTLEQWTERANQLYPVPATPPAHAYRPLAELAPTWMAMQAADAVTTELQAA